MRSRVREICRWTGSFAGVLLVTLSLSSCSPASAAQPAKRLVARAYNSGFALAHDTFNGMGVGSDGSVYYVLCSVRHDTAAQMYVFDPNTGRIRHLGDLTEAAGEKDKRVIAQGKSHVNFVETGGKLYFATHVGYYSIIDGKEKMGLPPEGWRPYPGGHLLAYDVKTGRFEDLAIAPGGEGIITMNMDRERKRIYFLTWPTGRFFRYDVNARALKDLGAFFLDGENGTGERYRTICRAIAVDPRDGSAYFTTGDGTIHRYRYEKDAVERVSGDDLRKDYFGRYDPALPGHMGYNWRQVFWNAADNHIYGVHGNSGYLFRFDPRAERVEVLDRITSKPSQRSGMRDRFSYGYLGFALGPDKRTIYYLTGGPVYVEGKRKGASKGAENVHLVTWDIPTGAYTDHGPVFLENGDRLTNVNSIAVGHDGTVYTLARVTADGRTRADLVAIRR